MKISANLMTFNEDRWLDICIENMYPYVDEIVVIDSGSTDNTINILKKYDKVRFYVVPQPGYNTTQRRPIGWNEGDRRNILKDLSKGDWILALGCDELLDDAVWPNLDSWMVDPSIDGYGFMRINYHYNFDWHRPVGDPKNAGEVRFYRNIPEIKVQTNNNHNYILYNNTLIHNHPKAKNTYYLLHHCHHTNFRGHKAMWDRGRDGSYINLDDLKRKGFHMTKDNRYRHKKPIVLPKILKDRGII